MQLWIHKESSLLVGCLPPDVQEEIDSADSGSVGGPDSLNLLGFTALILSSATQGFPDVAPEARTIRFFEFARASGGGTFLKN